MNSIQRASECVGGQRKLAAAIGVTPATVNQWVTGRRPIPSERCIDIERATAGAVTCEQLRPDLADRWAYLRGTNCPADQRDPGREVPHIMPAKRATNGHEEAA